MLQSYANIDAAHAEAVINRFETQLKKQSTMKGRTEFLELMDKVNGILTEVEEQLQKQYSSESKDSTKWLCCDSFTIADVSLTVLLHRLSSLGLESLFRTSGRSSTAQYYDRVCVRDSFIRSLPSPPKSQAKHQLSPIQMATVVSVISAAVVLLPLLSMTTK